MGKVYFISDLHLGASHDAETRMTERKVVRFLDSIRDDAQTIFLLGDILDYWYEYKYVVPKGFVRFFGKLAELTDAGIRIVWMIGNHDIWLRDYLPRETGIEVTDGVLTENLLGKKFFLTHGDGVGHMKRSFRFLRGLFRNRVCQFLYSSVNPRWTIPLAYAWSAHSRRHGCPAGGPDEPAYKNLLEFSRQYLEQHPDINYFVYGHLHILRQTSLSDTCNMVVLGDWIDTFSYGEYDGKELKLKLFDAPHGRS